MRVRSGDGQVGVGVGAEKGTYPLASIISTSIMPRVEVPVNDDRGRASRRNDALGRKLIIKDGIFYKMRSGEERRKKEAEGKVRAQRKQSQKAATAATNK